MKPNRPARKLREHPDLEQLKRQAKELLEAFRAGQTDAVAEINHHYRGADSATFALHDAQLALARSYGFESWPKLKAHVDGITVHRLSELVRANDIDRVRAMLKVRPELANMEMSYGNEHRPLHFAVMNRLPEMARLLMQHGADARRGIHPHRDATTAYRLAVERGFADVVAVIEEEEQRRRESMSASGTTVTSAQDELSEAISDGEDEQVIALLESDPARVHSCDREGWTPLHVAAAARNPKLVRWLIEHAADVNRLGKQGLTPLDLAAGSRWRIDPAQFASVAQQLRDAGAELTTRVAVALGEEEWLRARQGEGNLVNPIAWGAGGLLTLAVRHNQPGILAMLLDFGFDPDEQAGLVEGDGVSYSQGFPLWECAALGRREMAEILLERGANPNAGVDSSGSPVYSAYSHRHWEMVELLRRHGGIVGADTAAIYRQTDLVRQMIADEVADTIINALPTALPHRSEALEC